MSTTLHFPARADAADAGPSAELAADAAWEFETAAVTPVSLTHQLGYGQAHLNRDAAAAARLNVVRVSGGVDARTLLGDVERVFAGEAASVRRIQVRCGSVAVSLADALVAEGYRPGVETVLAHACRPTRPGRYDVPVRTLSGSADAGLAEQLWRSCDPELSAATMSQLLLGDLLRAGTTQVSRWAVLPDTRTPATRLVLSRQGPAAEVSQLFTTPGHRGRGFATALLLCAVVSAREHGALTVFARLPAESAALPLLTRSGFREAARWWTFERPA